MILSLLTIRVSYNDSGDEEYIGCAQSGKGETEKAWQIRKNVYDVSKRLISILYAEGNNQFRFKWSERATYNYK